MGSSDAQRELAREKRKDYRNMVLVQLALLVSTLLLEDLARLFARPLPTSFLKLLFYALSGLYLGLLWDMLRNFTRQRWLTRGVGLLLGLSFGALLWVDLVWGATEQHHATLRQLSHGGFFAVQALLVGMALRDLFRGGREDVDKLWGSACIFFMSGFAFAELFFLVLLRDPTAFGHRLGQEYWGLFEALYLSLTALIGLDNNAYPDCSRLVRNIVLLEGAWSQLYLVLLIGRLMTREDRGADKSQAATDPTQSGAEKSTLQDPP